MKIFQIQNDSKSAIRKVLKKLPAYDYAGLCKLGETTYIASTTADEQLRVNAIANEAITMSKTFIAIAPSHGVEKYTESQLVSVLFISEGKVVDARSGRLSVELTTYIAQQLANGYDNKIVKSPEINIKKISDIYSHFGLQLEVTDFNPPEPKQDDLYFYTKPVHELLSQNQERSKGLLILGCVILASMAAAFWGFKTFIHQDNTVTYVTKDEHAQYRNALKDAHVSEEFFHAMKVADKYFHREGWTMKDISVSRAGKYKATIAPYIDSAPQTPFLLWSRNNAGDDKLKMDAGVFVLEGAFERSDYIKGFKRWIVDLDLNLSQLRDLNLAAGVESFEVSTIKQNKNYRSALITFSGQSMTLKKLNELYEAYKRIPLMSVKLDITDNNDGSFNVTQTMELVGI
ncbi:hypothetical protein [Vibrio gangliei]|uniref:hypothetical protein n=1 Tax=Vibrio gangliei TaxID=2077090 RepID=UPI000D01C418|nr:hypothetical protein [Vibrio gangliei]